MNERKPDRTGLRREHPVFFWGTMSLIALFVLGTLVVGSRIPRYSSEEAQIVARMSETERATRDALLEHGERRTQLSLALLQRDVRVRSLEQRGVHLALSVEDSTLSLRHGPIMLRTAKVAVGGDSTITAPDGRTWRLVQPVGERRIREKQNAPTYTIPEWVYVSRGEPVPPEAERRVKRGLGTYVIRLDDGTEIYSQPPTGPLADEVKPAAFMAQTRDLAAIFEAVRVDTPVFIY